MSESTSFLTRTYTHIKYCASRHHFPLAHNIMAFSSSSSPSLPLVSWQCVYVAVVHAAMLTSSASLSFPSLSLPFFIFFTLIVTLLPQRKRHKGPTTYRIKYLLLPLVFHLRLLQSNWTIKGFGGPFSSHIVVARPRETILSPFF